MFQDSSFSWQTTPFLGSTSVWDYHHDTLGILRLLNHGQLIWHKVPRYDYLYFCQFKWEGYIVLWNSFVSAFSHSNTNSSVPFYSQIFPKLMTINPKSYPQNNALFQLYSIWLSNTLHWFLCIEVCVSHDDAV